MMLLRGCIYLLFIAFASNVHAELNVMTLNAEWLWTPHDHRVDGNRFNKGDMSPAAYKNELEFYAELIRTHNVQVLAISEIENEAVANDLARTIGKGWRAYFKQGRDTATGQDVAILSNLPYVKGSLTDFNFPSSNLLGVSGQYSSKKKRLSKVVGAQFLLTGMNGTRKLGVITAHLLSKRQGSLKKDQNRERQAYAFVKAIDDFRGKSDQLIILGDFNDVIGSPTMLILMQKNTLLSTEVEFDRLYFSGQRTKKKQIDHILYRGLELIEHRRFDLQKYSDHDAIFAGFK